MSAETSMFDGPPVTLVPARESGSLFEDSSTKPPFFVMSKGDSCELFDESEGKVLSEKRPTGKLSGATKRMLWRQGIRGDRRDGVKEGVVKQAAVVGECDGRQDGAWSGSERDGRMEVLGESSAEPEGRIEVFGETSTAKEAHVDPVTEVGLAVEYFHMDSGEVVDETLSSESSFSGESEEITVACRTELKEPDWTVKPLPRLSPPSSILAPLLSSSASSGSTLPPIDHLLLIVHGINGTVDNLDWNLDRFRQTVEEVRAKKFPALSVHCEMINWKSSVIGIQASLFERITPRHLSIESRMFINYAMSDLAFYLTPSHSEYIRRVVASMLNDRVDMLRKQDPRFEKSKVSLVGYSLGSAILHDLLENTLVGRASSASTSTPGNTYANSSSSPSSNPCSNPTITFPVHNLFLWGSPLGAYLSVRDVGYQNGKFILPRHFSVHNVYHPHDPVAFRIEPLFYYLDSEVAPAEVIPYWDELTASGVERKKEVGWWGAIFGAPIEEESAMLEDESQPAVRTNEVQQLLPKRRLDFVLQETVTENLSHKYSMLTSHHSYWGSRDLALFMLKKMA